MRAPPVCGVGLKDVSRQADPGSDMYCIRCSIILVVSLYIYIFAGKFLML